MFYGQLPPPAVVGRGPRAQRRVEGAFAWGWDGKGLTAALWALGGALVQGAWGPLLSCDAPGGSLLSPGGPCRVGRCPLAPSGCPSGVCTGSRAGTQLGKVTCSE